MIEGTFGMYKAFLIVEHPVGVIKAYRNPAYFRNDVSSYEVTGINWLGMNAIIDKAEDYGEFTEEQYEGATGERLPR